ncbi:hypothetical protein JDV02_003960 [Purpureocillium takamizusanense]|uniref:Myb transcription factor n=1 Tax=Purpureocillium takamizusanense TaxID=2060973 RepID=A0A9Q8VAB4_9HYPO|nr:uncharacterized protein JDV02_003960 [Purpureocillium takamizusanense]UNI17631.1 hypothetical protein JDV02_003960 [Purpureocillium takamizusanense]
MSSASSRWPDFRLASTLRSLIGSQSGRLEQLAPAQREVAALSRQGEDNASAHGLQGNANHLAMAHLDNQMPEGLGGFPGDGNEDGSLAGDDVDFGALEMFDSNASQAFSSQANAPFPSSGHAPEAIMSEDQVAPTSSKKSKRDKKHRKKSFSDDAGLSQSVLEDEGGKKKHKKSKRRSTRELEDPSSQAQAVALSSADAVAPAGADDPGQGLEAVAASLDLNGDDGAVPPSTHSKKKRKLSDSTDRKRHKKRRSHGQESAEGDGAAAASTGFLHRKKDKGVSVERAIEEEQAPDSDPQRSPTVAHLRRRSQSREARSRENSIPPASAEQMDIDLGEPEHHAARADSMDLYPDVEALAREAWNEHRNGQKALADAQEEQVLAAEEQLQPEPSQDAQATTHSPRRTRSTRKKAKPTFFEQPPPEIPDDDDANRDALGELPSPTALTPKPRKRAKAAAKKTSKGRKPKREKLSQSMRGGSHDDGEYESSQPSRRNRLIGYTQGRFSDDELARIGKAVEGFRAEQGLTKEQVNAMIHAPGGTTAGDEHAQLWVRIFAECPDRHRQKLINITRKKFHNFVARGTWTAEQDAELNELISVHGTKWSKIAALINRHPEDLRDRYRNYLVCGPYQRKDAWDEAEEARLTQYVIDAMEAIDELRNSEPNHHLLTRSYEELIDWQNISERMDRTRSRLQCITKWKSLNVRVSGKDKLLSGEPDAQISFRLEKARRQLSAMPDEEKYRLVLAIQGTAVGKDKKVPWQRLVDKQYRNQWHRVTQMLLWRRLRETVPGGETMTTRDCAQYLIDQYNQNGELPDVVHDGYDDVQEMEFVQQIPTSTVGVSGTQAQRERGEKSSEFVTASDAEQDVPATNGEGVLEEQEIQIDPALTEASDVMKKATPAKRTGSGKPPSSRKRQKRAAIANMDPIEDDAQAEQQPAEQRENSDIDVEQFRAKKTPSKFKSRAKGQGEDHDTSKMEDSDSDMDDMEDLPSKVVA